jgi:hypothetical protein
MITIENYFQRVDKTLLNSIPDALLEFHEYVQESTDNGEDLSIYKEDPAIRETIDNYLEKLNAYLEKKKIKSIENKKPEEKMAPVFQQEKPRSIPEKKARQTKPQKVKKAASKSVSPKPVVKVHSKSVEKIDDAVRIIQRYVGLHGKSRTVSQLMPLLKTIQKAILEKRIGLKHKYADQIKTIQDQLVKIFNKNKPDTLIGPITITEPALSSYVKIAGGEKIYKSISFLKRLVGLQGKMLSKDKLELFSASVNRAAIPDTDPYASKLSEVLKTLKKSYQNGSPLEISKQELHGLNGIIKTCSCNHDLGTIYKSKVRGSRQCRSKRFSDSKGQGSCSHHRGLKGLGELPSSMSAQEMMNQKVEYLPFEGSWKGLVGNPAPGFKMMVHGGPGSGKSSMLIQMAYYLATNFGPVMYVTSEEYTPKTIQSKLSQLPNIPSGLDFFKQLEPDRIAEFKFVIIDSVNHMKLGYDQFLKLVEKHPDVSFIFILQHTKQGMFKGGMDWEHEADIAMEVNDHTAKTYKNRFGVKGSCNFFNPDWNQPKM